MSAPSDKFGRPVVVVTGMGVVTSLGAGKEDNWRRLTAGESGISSSISSARAESYASPRWPT